jgi:hypothetical protein
VRRLLEILAFVMAVLLPGQTYAANTFGADFSDLWWNPAESGWGANIAHQGDTLFMTLFVYGPDSKQKWYVASSMASRGGEPSHAFDGTLYETTGPFLGAASFDPGSVTRRAVGTASVQFSSITTGTLTYTVEGATVTKSMERNTFRANDLSGSYLGGQVGSKTDCGTSSGAVESAARYSVTHSGTDITISASLGNNLYCTYSGTYAQAGKMGSIDGKFACTDGSGGRFYSAGIEASDKGFLGRYFAEFGGVCVESGVIGGVKQ